MRLVYDDTKNEVKTGDKVTTGKGEPCEVVYVVKPHKPGSTGRVALKFEDGWQHEYFPGVIGAGWIEREDHTGYFADG